MNEERVAKLVAELTAAWLHSRSSKDIIGILRELRKEVGLSAWPTSGRA